MTIIFGSGLVVGVLWLWLSAHWFGRVLAFLAFGSIGVIAMAFALDHRVGPQGDFVNWILLITSLTTGIGGGWFVASIPTVIARKSEREASFWV